LEFGARFSGQYETEKEALRKLLAPFETYDYEAVFSPGHYGRLRDGLERKGRAIGAMDMLIASHALALGATLVTNNAAHFSRVEGLSFVNWLP
jgi:tRNA(fMet)-specific endonuclease VapC